MSDYLWDKTGERDAEVERLENLLGQLRHQPRKLELPGDELRAANSRRATSSSASRFYRVAALVAAALALASLLGALLALRGTHQPATAPATAAATAETPETLVSTTPAETPETVVTAAPGTVEASGAGHDSPIHSARAGAQASGVGTAKKVRRDAGRGLGSADVSRADARARAAEDVRANVGAGTQAATGETLSGVEAKEQLLYALRLASAQLGEVRRKTLGVVAGPDAEEPKPPTR
jgi:hypothetical protein